MQNQRPVNSLPSELTIYTVGELAPQCLAWIDSRAGADLAEDDEDADDDGSEIVSALRVDAHAVEDIDAAGVQLLLSLSNALARQQRPLQLVRPSAPLRAACEALGAGGLMAHAELSGDAS